MTALPQIPPAESSEIFATHSARGQHEVVIAVELTHVLHSWIADPLAQLTHNAGPRESKEDRRSQTNTLLSAPQTQHLNQDDKTQSGPP
jgi:hypothetical protein